MHVDLNLLIALDALLEENSVAAAADRLHLSPPAMSRTLSRIRRATGDDILVRTGRAMSPTPRALELRDETRELVRRARVVLTPPRTLDLETLDRVFTIRGHDALAVALGPPLTMAIASSAPNVQVRLLAEPSADVADLARGHADLGIGAEQPERPEITAETIGTDHMVAVAPRRPPPRRWRARPERFAAARHVTVSRRGHLRGVIDDVLAERGLRRRVVASLPTSSAALKLVASTDLLAVVADRSAVPAGPGSGWTPVRCRSRSAVPVIVTWHRRNDTDPANAWLRMQVRRAFRAILEADR